jgi:hypothetical protein
MASGLDESWVLGFLAGAGDATNGANPLNGLDANAVFGWIDNYCSIHPLSPIGKAAEALFNEHPD